jgi:hypothetical protein
LAPALSTVDDVDGFVVEKQLFPFFKAFAGFGGFFGS